MINISFNILMLFKITPCHGCNLSMLQFSPLIPCNHKRLTCKIYNKALKVLLHDLEKN